jgi:hypothetical protein
MATITKMFASILLLALSGMASADNSGNTTPAIPDTDTVSNPQTQLTPVQNISQTRQLMEELHFHMLELQSILSQQSQNMTLVKTKTAWIRKRLADLHDWSLKQTATADTEKLFGKFCILIYDMEEEVKRDDMLDNIELQSLLINYTQAEHALTGIERKSAETNPPINNKPE